MIQRKLLLVAAALLLLAAGIAVAESATGYVLQRFATSSGGTADSASYTVTSVIGQSAAGVVDNANYKVRGGFISPRSPGSDVVNQIWLPVVTR